MIYNFKVKCFTLYLPFTPFILLRLISSLNLRINLVLTFCQNVCKNEFLKLIYFLSKTFFLCCAGISRKLQAKKGIFELDTEKY